MGVDWSQLSAPQAAVLAAAIGIVSAVIGQFAGTIISVIASARQARKNRELELLKLNRQLETELARRRTETTREAFVAFQTAAHDLHSHIVVAKTTGQIALARPASQDPNGALLAVSKLQSALTLVTLATQSIAVIEAVQAVKKSLDLELSGQHSDYVGKMRESLAAMQHELQN